VSGVLGAVPCLRCGDASKLAVRVVDHRVRSDDASLEVKQ